MTFYLCSGLLAALALPTLLPFHRHPQTVFWQEWWSAVALVVLAGVLVFAGRLRVGGLGLGCSVMAGVLLASDDGAGGWLAYAALGALAWVLGGAAVLTKRDGYGGAGMLPSTGSRSGLEIVCAAALLISALLQALLGFCQLLGVNGGWLMPRLYLAVYGNIAQPNHYANLLWLGLASLAYLWARSARLVGWLVVPAAFLTVAAALSASRSVFLFMLALPVLSWLVGQGGADAGRRLRSGALVVLVLSVLAQGLVSSGLLSGSKVVSAASRIDEGGSNGQRLFDWEVAAKTALEHPFTGSGIGSFAWQTAEHAAKLQPTSFVRIGENAHNTPLHLAAELGLVPALVIVGSFAWWFIRQLRSPPTPERWWCLAIVSIIGLHSLVEYPLWYTYFIVPFFLAIGLADAQDEGLRTISFSSRWLLLPVAVGVFVLGWALHDYRALEEGYAVIEDAQRDVAHVESLALKVDGRSMFAPHAGILRIRNWGETDRTQAATVAGLCDTAARAKPSLEVLERCVTAYAWSGRDADAQHYVDVICGAYPAVYHGDVKRRVASLAAEGHALLTCRL